ncbi:hypothetical protein AVEN_263980-1 [Araneus ventricosus]|uniref:Uncharacterized protein n=1 Tax=Araneus ventricosus TaxID=182803 RepID=A0A4Y2C2B0_ARAVE|nr:hypothetical protein AVEN_85327-1 [Araneus ventricosus]GBL97474.1 hypothetical protein AVEN_235774-1 [Araneus ventricosus]GBL97766.1 hypothetical protein AVEN_192227-1 [Araneus ventricosus]GBL97785.1 hypothetical protein AVEN_263980-1 [Araneus ventricosus]
MIFACNLFPENWIPRPALVSGFLNDSCFRSSSTEIGVLLVITDHGLTPTVGGTYHHRRRIQVRHYYTHQGSENPHIYPVSSNLYTRGRDGKNIPV